MSEELSANAIVQVIGGLAERPGPAVPGRSSFSRLEIADYLGVLPDDISEEKSEPPTGPLGEAVHEGLIEEDHLDRYFWRLTPGGQARLDSALFLSSPSRRLGDNGQQPHHEASIEPAGEATPQTQ